MYYTFITRQEQNIQMDFDDLFQNFTNTQTVPELLYTEEYPVFFTTQIETISPQMQEKCVNYTRMLRHNATLFQNPTEENYTEFLIPKRSGGTRKITAPKEDLKQYQDMLYRTFQKSLGILPHNAAFAYVPNRMIKHALQKHQKNESKWYLKIDLKDFFPSCTKELVLFRLSQIYPFPGIPDLRTLLNPCFLNNSLPQGSPSSPFLSNMIMVSYDDQITAYAHEKGLIYTRYADDITISSKCYFSKDNVVNVLQRILQPFVINTEKTRFGSRNGHNYNLGLITNQQNNISLGHKKKKNIKAILHNFRIDLTNNQPWDKLRAQALLGQLSYYLQIEPDYITYIIQKYSEGLPQSIPSTLRNIIREG